MATVPNFEVLDLRHFNSGSLRSLLEIETRIWDKRLNWDYRPSANLLAQYLDSRVLPGFVTVEAGRATGYTFCVYEGSKAVIGDVFAANGLTPAIEQENTLVRHMLEMLVNSPDVDRIESQLLLYPRGALRNAFAEWGFAAYPRLFLELRLSERPQQPLPELPAELELRCWTNEDFNAAARLIPQAYEGHLDSHINDQYVNEMGSRRFLHNIVRFPGCGAFDAKCSLVLAHRHSNELAGVVLCSRVRKDVGHITQICIHPAYQHRGLGRLLLESAAGAIAAEGLQALTLTVTEENHHAAALYLAMGYRQRHSFDAWVWCRRKLRAV